MIEGEAPMADITRLPLLRHLRAGPTAYVRDQRNGRLVHEGVGLSFWFRPLAAAISEVPVDDRELPLLFHARTRDYQDVSVQAAITFRVVDPAMAAARVDFSIDLEHGRWDASPLEQIGGLLTELAQQHALSTIARMTLTEALAEGVAEVRSSVSTGLGTDRRLAETGIEVVAVRVVAIRAEAEVERALQTPTREAVQQDADRAMYERRALAVERELTIAENELHNQIELARREEELVAQRGQNSRREAEEQAATSGIVTGAEAERSRNLAGAEADATRMVGTAEADAETARLAAYRSTDAAILLALAVKELAANLPEIGTLTVTPDLLTPILARLGGTVKEVTEK
jgi:regulator of protease activity HflC (stomatin/prohibitin superfamily)